MRSIQDLAMSGRFGAVAVLLFLVTYSPPVFAPPGMAPHPIELPRPIFNERGFRPERFGERPDELTSPEQRSRSLDVARTLDLEIRKSSPKTLAAAIEIHEERDHDSDERRRIDAALSEGRIDDLILVPSVEDPNDFLLQLRASKPREIGVPVRTPEQWAAILSESEVTEAAEKALPTHESDADLLGWLNKADPTREISERVAALRSREPGRLGKRWAKRLGEHDLPMNIHVEPAKVSVKAMLKEAVSNGARERLQTVDRLILTQLDPSLASPAPWRASVRLIEYSARDQTLTVKPPEPLKRFVIRITSDGEGIHPRGQAILRQYARGARNAVRSGDGLPAEVSIQLTLLKGPEIVRSPRSQNQTLEQISRAAELGKARFGSKPAVVFDGLPYPGVGPSGMWQLFRMKLDVFSGSDWRDLRKSTNLSSLGGRTRVIKMEREALLGELRSGSNDVLVLIAHNVDGKIYTSDGNEVPITEIENIRRDRAPDRAIILITCNAGGVGGAVASLAETLLQNRLATAVFGSSGVVDASKLPALLADLKSKPMSEALAGYQLQHIVSIGKNLDG